MVALLIAALLAACSGDGGIEASGAWGRESPSTAQNGALYLELRNEGDGADALTGVRSDACGRAELHESSMDEQGVMRMAPVEDGRLPLPAGETVSLRPGGVHIMCAGLVEPFVSGEQILLVLEFEKHAPLEVEAEIRRDAP
jgi:copper(I)-binding protein